MDVSEIVDEASFKRWLDALPRGTEAEREEARRWAVTLAHRAAMRVLPVFWEWSVVQTNRKQTVLPVFRANLTSSLSLAMPLFPAPTLLEVERAAYPDEAISAGAFNAYSAGIAAAKALSSTSKPGPNMVDAHFAFSASETALKAIFSFVTKALGPAYFWSGVRTDATALVAGKDPYLFPLWPAENPLAAQWSTISTHPSTQTPGWRFWIDWYDRALTGQPQDWKLLEKVALIDPKDWDKGEDHVNALIQKIIRDHRPPPPKLTPEIRAHLDLVLTLRDPSRQSAGYLKGRFEALEQAYRQTVGCPNETPEELEPIVTLARAFGQIEWLLTNETNKDRLIHQLEVQIAELRANNAALIAVARGEKASFMRGVFVGALGGTIGGVATEIITGGAKDILVNLFFLGGPATADSLEPLAKLLTGPVVDLSPSIPR